MKKFIVISILIAYGNPISGQNCRQIGYINGDPIIVHLETSKFFKVSENLRLVPFDPGFGEKTPLFISDCGMLGTSFENKRHQLTCEINHFDLNLDFSNKINSAILSEDCKFMAVSSQDTISVYKNGVLVNKINGRSPQIVDNNLFYHMALKNDPGFVDVYKSSLDDLANREIILTNVVEPGILVLENGDFVACAILVNGLNAAIYDTRSKKFKSLMKADLNNFPVYFPKSKSIRYYNHKRCTFSKIVKYR